jgi:hypothetical protein
MSTTLFQRQVYNVDAISIPHDGSSSGLELTQLEIKQDEDKGNDPF